MHQLAQFYQALGGEVRLKIIQMLIGQERCVCDILEAFDLSQPAVSHHLKVLKQAGVLNTRRKGKWIYYSLNREQLRQVNLFWATIMEHIDEPDTVHECE